MEKKITTFRQGEVIFRKGDVQLWFYEIVSGGVSIYTDYGMPSEKLLVEMKPGQTFGEMAVLGYRSRSATAVAASDTEVIRIDERDLESYIAENPQRLLAFMRQMSDRTRELTRDYADALHTVSCIRQDKKEEGLLARILRFAHIGRA